MIRSPRQPEAPHERPSSPERKDTLQELMDDLQQAVGRLRQCPAQSPDSTIEALGKDIQNASLVVLEELGSLNGADIGPTGERLTQIRTTLREARESIPTSANAASRDALDRALELL